MSELKTLTLNGKTYDTFPDKTAREVLRYKQSSFYSTTREVLDGADKDSVNVDYVLALYDALMEAYPEKVHKNAISNDDGTFTNYEYVISVGEYNTAGKRGVLDTDIKKPKYLILSGIHGCEKNAVISTYRFIRDVLSDHNALYHFREGSVIHIMPMGNPAGVDGMQRTNGNGVDINRNFDWNWIESGSGTTRYSGTAAVSEKETQAIVSWLKANRDADLFLDIHNSANINEVSMFAGMADNNTVERLKRTAMRGVGRAIPLWRDVIGYTAHDMTKDGSGTDMQDTVYSYSSTVDIPGLANEYAMGALGIPSLALELSDLQNGDMVDCVDEEGKPTYEKIFDPETVAAGAEVIGNVLLEFYTQHLSDCNRYVPVNGVYYFTQNDKTDMVNAVLVALLTTPTGEFAYYSTLISAVNDVNSGTIGTNADADSASAVAGVYVYNERPYVVLMQDTTETARVEPKVGMTINLNGHTVTVAKDMLGIKISADNVVIDGRADGSGVTVSNGESVARAIQVSSGRAVISGGLYAAITTNETGMAQGVYVGNSGTLVISNCEATATGYNGIAFAISGEATISNCKGKGTSPDSVNANGLSITRVSDISVYMDNCDFSDMIAENCVISVGGSEDKNNALYVSNSVLPEGAEIVIGNDTNKLYIGKGNNFTASDTNMPDAVVTTDEEYTVAS